MVFDSKPFAFSPTDAEESTKSKHQPDSKELNMAPMQSVIKNVFTTAYENGLDIKESLRCVVDGAVSGLDSTGFVGGREEEREAGGDGGAGLEPLSSFAPAVDGSRGTKQAPQDNIDKTHTDMADGRRELDDDDERVETKTNSTIETTTRSIPGTIPTVDINKGVDVSKVPTRASTPRSSRRPPIASKLQTKRIQVPTHRRNTSDGSCESATTISLDLSKSFEEQTNVEGEGEFDHRSATNGAGADPDFDAGAGAGAGADTYYTSSTVFFPTHDDPLTSGKMSPPSSPSGTCNCPPSSPTSPSPSYNYSSSRVPVSVVASPRDAPQVVMESPLSPSQQSAATNLSYISSSSSEEGLFESDINGIFDQEGDPPSPSTFASSPPSCHPPSTIQGNGGEDLEDDIESVSAGSQVNNSDPWNENRNGNPPASEFSPDSPTAKNTGISATTERLVKRFSSSSLNLVSSRESQQLSPETTAGAGLASLDTILMSSSSLSTGSREEASRQTPTTKAQSSSTNGTLGELLPPVISESLKTALRELSDLDQDDDFDYSVIEDKGSFESISEKKVLGENANESISHPKAGTTNRDSKSNPSLQRHAIDEDTDISKVSGPQIVSSQEVVSSSKDRGQCQVWPDSISDLSSGRIEDCGTRRDAASGDRQDRGKTEILQKSIEAHEKSLQEKTAAVIQDLEMEYQERVEAMKRRYAMKLNREKRRLEIQFEERKEEYTEQRDPKECTSSVDTAETGGTSQAPLDFSIVIHNTTEKTVSSTDSDTILTMTKKRKDAMEERMYNLLNRLHTPRRHETMNNTSMPCKVRGLEMPRTPIDTSSLLRDDVELDEDFLEQKLESVKWELLSERSMLKEHFEGHASFQRHVTKEVRQHLDSLQEAALRDLTGLQDRLEMQQREQREKGARMIGEHRGRVEEIESQAQLMRENCDRICSTLVDCISERKNTISNLLSKIEATNNRNNRARMDEEVEKQEKVLHAFRNEAKYLRERVKNLTREADLLEKEQNDELETEQEKTERLCERVRSDVQASIDRQYNDGSAKTKTLEKEHEKVVERLGALKKLLIIQKASNSTVAEGWRREEEGLRGEIKGLEEGIGFTNEKGSNKTAAFARVSSQLSNSYEDLLKGINDTKKDIESSKKHTALATMEISQLRDDNAQVDLWIKELTTVINALE